MNSFRRMYVDHVGQFEVADKHVASAKEVMCELLHTQMRFFDPLFPYALSVDKLALTVLGYLRITYYKWKHCEAFFDGSTAGDYVSRKSRSVIRLACERETCRMDVP
jgi:hypothetical protein